MTLNQWILTNSHIFSYVFHGRFRKSKDRVNPKFSVLSHIKFKISNCRAGCDGKFKFTHCQSSLTASNVAAGPTTLTDSSRLTVTATDSLVLVWQRISRTPGPGARRRARRARRGAAGPPALAAGPPALAASRGGRGKMIYHGESLVTR
jgi:hypothetical protein